MARGTSGPGWDPDDGPRLTDFSYGADNDPSAWSAEGGSAPPEPGRSRGSGLRDLTGRVPRIRSRRSRREDTEPEAQDAAVDPRFAADVDYANPGYVGRRRSPGEKDGVYGRHLSAEAEPEVVRKHFIDYPRAGKHGVLRWLPSWRLVTGAFLFVILSFVVLVVVIYVRTTIPEVSASAQAQKTVFYFRDGKTVLGTVAEQNRQIISIKVLPQYVPNEVLSAEDRTFRTNSGVSLTGIARALYNDVRGRPLQGGSTITQQYVKNSYLSPKRTWQRKISEIFIAVKIARTKSKDDILERYLNTVYFGRGAYGIQVAAQTWFGVPASQLTISQGAFLAGILNGPELYDPADGANAKTRALMRWNYVLDGMVKEGWLDAATRAKQIFPTHFSPVAHESKPTGQDGYLLLMAEQEMRVKYNITKGQLGRMGLSIVTTFDPHLTGLTTFAVRSTLKDEKVPDGTRVGMVVMDPKGGAVRAIYGGSDNFDPMKQNAATQDIAQPGSTFKPLALAGALQQTYEGKGDVTLNTEYDGKSPQTFHVDGFPPYTTQNEGNTSYKQMNLITGLAKSVNTVYMGLNQQITPKVTADAAIAAGVPKREVPVVPSNALGTATLHVIDMADAYATLASGGFHSDAHVIESISGQDAPTVDHPKPQQVFATPVVDDVTYAMQQVTKPGGTAYRQVHLLGRPVAGKTGTTNSHVAVWFNGFTPDLVATVAMYRTVMVKGQPTAMPVEINGEVQVGGNFPAAIWTTFMQRALGDVPTKEFAPPAWVGLDGAPSTAPPTTTDTQPAVTTAPPLTPTGQPTLSPLTPTWTTTFRTRHQPTVTTAETPTATDTGTTSTTESTTEATSATTEATTTSTTAGHGPGGGGGGG